MLSWWWNSRNLKLVRRRNRWWHTLTLTPAHVRLTRGQRSTSSTRTRNRLDIWRCACLLKRERRWQPCPVLLIVPLIIHHTGF
ncbi:hypothetical protein Hanom_Chr05g00454251 [Helianthus anomalus]